MAIEIFTTVELNEALDELPPPKAFLLTRYFTTEILSDTQDVMVDVVIGRRRMSPFCSPLVAGRVVASNGYYTNTYRPAYIKDLRVFDADRPMERMVGEKIGGQLTPDQRVAQLMVKDMQDQINMATQRFEWMCAQALLRGKFVMSGPGYPETLIDFQRDPALTITKLPGSLWTDPGSQPLADLAAWSSLTRKKGLTAAKDVLMTEDVWNVFRNHPTVKERWNSLNELRAALRLDAATEEGGEVMGSIDGFTVIVYTDTYVDPDDGKEYPMFPAGTVVLGSSAIEGRRHFGVIKDIKYGYQKRAFFAKTWTEENPSVQNLLLQSSPLMAPYRPNCSLCAKVM